MKSVHFSLQKGRELKRYSLEFLATSSAMEQCCSVSNFHRGLSFYSLILCTALVCSLSGINIFLKSQTFFTKRLPRDIDYFPGQRATFSITTHAMTDECGSSLAVQE